jgi:hypothetical protein
MEIVPGIKLNQQENLQQVHEHPVAELHHHKHEAQEAHVCGPECEIHSRPEALAEANAAIDAILNGATDTSPVEEHIHEHPATESNHHKHEAQEAHVCGPECEIHSRPEALAEANAAIDAILNGTNKNAEVVNKEITAELSNETEKPLPPKLEEVQAPHRIQSIAEQEEAVRSKMLQETQKQLYEETIKDKDPATKIVRNCYLIHLTPK